MVMLMVNEKNVKQGAKNRKSGAYFELRVKKDMVGKGWIVSKFPNQVEFDEEGGGKLMSAKHKWRGRGLPMVIGTGFPDFVCWKKCTDWDKLGYYEVIGVEAKSNGKLSAEEKEKCKWLLENDVFSKILIAFKGEKRGEIVYDEFII